MSLPMSINLANPDPNTPDPQSLQELVNILRPLLSGEVTGTYLAYVQGSATPAVEDQDKIWHRTDVGGRPLGTFKFYNGGWRRQYSGLPSQFRYFRGNPETYFDAAGRGLTTTEWDGWHLCNGAGGTPDIPDRFLVSSEVYNEASGQWTIDYQGSPFNVGGNKEWMITEAQLPPLDIDIVGNKLDQGGQPNFAEHKIIIDDDYIPATEETVNMGHYGATEDQTKIPTLPPFFACALCMWVGYA